MTYKYKDTTTRCIFSGLSVILDILLLPLIIKLAWNNILVDVVKVQTVTYIQVFCLKFGYSAFTNNWFSEWSIISRNENRFDEYANMISTRFLQLMSSTNEIKTRFQNINGVGHLALTSGIDMT